MFTSVHMPTEFFSSLVFFYHTRIPLIRILFNRFGIEAHLNDKVVQTLLGQSLSLGFKKLTFYKTGGGEGDGGRLLGGKPYLACGLVPAPSHHSNPAPPPHPSEGPSLSFLILFMYEYILFGTTSVLK